MCQLPLDGVGVPQARLVQYRRRRRTKAMTCHFVLCEAEPAQGGVDRVFRHAARRRADRGEKVFSAAG